MPIWHARRRVDGRSTGCGDVSPPPYFTGALPPILLTGDARCDVGEVLIWLIAAGLIMAGLATVAYVIDFAARRRIDRPAWPRDRYALQSTPRSSNPSFIAVTLHSRSTAGPDAFRLVVIVLALRPGARALTNRHRLGSMIMNARPQKRTRETCPVSPLSLLPVAALDSRLRRSRRRPKMQIGANPRCRAAAVSSRRCESQRSSDGETKLPVAPGLQVHALAAGFEHPRSPTSCPMETCWWSRATVRKLLSTGRRYHYRWVQSFAGAKAKDANPLRCCAAAW